MATPQRIVVIGAAGGMMSVAVRRLAAVNPSIALELYDLDSAQVRALAADLSCAKHASLDLFDRAALSSAIAGARLVVLGAGPYLRTSGAVIDACIAAGVDYLDFADDNEPTTSALARSDEVAAAGIGAFVGCGASPGLSNVMAVDAASNLDEVESIDVAWCTGDEGPQPYGRAVIEHLMHIAAGDCLTWRDGASAVVESYAASAEIDMGGGLGKVSLYECAHPEAVTLPRRFPDARSIRVLGGLHPMSVNGIARGVAVAVRDGKLDADVAVKFFQDIMQDKVGSLAAWRYAIPEMRAQVRRQEVTGADLRHFLWNAMRGRHVDYQGGLLAIATGTRAGEQTTVVSRTELAGPETTLWQTMGTVTGLSIAAFTMLALTKPTGERVGVMCPEDWVDPAAMYTALQALGVPEAELPTKKIVGAG